MLLSEQAGYSGDGLAPGSEILTSSRGLMKAQGKHGKSVESGV